MKSFDRAAVVATVIATLTLLAACGDDTADDRAPEEIGTTTDTADDRAPEEIGTTADTADDRFPDVIGATATETDDDVWRFDATLSSPYDSPERYADAWRVIGDDGVVYGVRELTHDHQNEQPFTRSLSGVEIPGAVAVVTVEGRDQLNGWGGDTSEVALRP